MKNPKNQILVVVIVLVLSTLSCSLGEVSKYLNTPSRVDMVFCLATGGIWTYDVEEGTKAGYCDRGQAETNDPPVVENPSQVDNPVEEADEQSEPADISTSTPELDEQNDMEPIEDLPLEITDCFAIPGEFSWGYEDIERQDCTDTSRCTGCGGTFFVQNNTNQELYFRYYYYQDFSTPIFDGWKQTYLPLQPGERTEVDVSISNRLSQGITYKSNVVKIVMLIPASECLLLSDAEVDSQATLIDPLPCE